MSDSNSGSGSSISLNDQALAFLATWKAKLTSLGSSTTGDMEKAFLQGALAVLQSVQK